MKVIAKKHKYAENNYKIALMVSCGMIFMSAVMTIMSLCEYDGLSKEIAYISIPLGICAIIFTILYLLMEFIPAIKIPQDIISVDEDMGEIFLHPDKITIMARDVKSISCERMEYQRKKRRNERISDYARIV